MKETLLAIEDPKTTTTLATGEAEEGRVLLPTPVMLRAGDACIAAYHLPHSASLNEAGPIREQIIFRFGLKGTGEGYNLPAWEVDSWRQQLCDQWRGFPGMEAVVAEGSASPALERMRTELRRQLAD